MPNRSTYAIPAVYVDTTSDWDIAGECHGQVYSLDIFDVTYLHFHNTLELGLCISGEGVCYVEEREYPFRSGDVQVIFPFQRHLSKSTGAESSTWYWLNLDPLRLLLMDGFTQIEQVNCWLHLEMGMCGIFRRDDHPKIAGLVEQMLRARADPAGERAHLSQYLCASLYLLILELCEASAGKPVLSLRSGEHMEALLPALDRIKSDLENNLKPTVSALSKLCGMSAANFRKVFTNAIGLSPQAYILSSCVRKARQLLLTTDESILQIGLSVGFEDISGFNRCFASHMGMTPSEYRRRRGES